jgi:putative two-component system response regulator
MHVLIVDDRPADRFILKVLFQAHGCETSEAENGREGLALAAQRKPDLIVSDALMPVLDGFGFLREIKADQQLKDIPFVFYSAVYTGHQDEHLATSLGAEAFLIKPLEPERLWLEVSAIMEKIRAGGEVKARSETPGEEQYLREYSNVVVAKLEEKVRELEEMSIQLVQTLVNLIDAKSPWTRGHSERVAELAVRIAREMGLDENKVNTVRLGALLHDIGKIGTYDTLLDKSAALSDDEYAIVKGHPDRGADALAAIAQLKDVIPVIRYHHENMDGSGYPHRLDHEAIPLNARIVSVADAYDSMTATRPYRPAPGREYAIAEIKRCSGIQFDPEVVAALLRTVVDAKE